MEEMDQAYVEEYKGHLVVQREGEGEQSSSHAF